MQHALSLLAVAAFLIFMLKRRAPALYGGVKNWTLKIFRLFRLILLWFWRKPQRKGGGTPKQPPMRWRE